MRVLLLITSLANYLLHTSVPAVLNDFSISLFKRLVEDNERDNIFLSPLSVSTALSMILLGARGPSADELRRGMHFGHIDTRNGKTVHQLFNEVSYGSFDLHILKRSAFLKLYNERIRNSSSVCLSNYLLIQNEEILNPVLEKYKDEMQLLFGAKVNGVNFTADGSQIQESVNEWVSSNTNGFINSMMDSHPDQTTAALILNAIYFKGKWRTPFSSENTAKMPFFTRTFSRIEKEFMITRKERLLYQKLVIAGEDVQILELPYSSDAMSMLIILPSKTMGFQKIIASPNFVREMGSLLRNINRTLQYKLMNLFLPKFKLETEYTLIPALKELGITQVFTPGVADLSGMNGQKNLVISQMKHKAVVKVDEEGTEAAASTLAVPMRPSAPFSGTPIEFRVDHPFLFVIRDRETGLVFFVGKVEEL